MTSDRRYRTCRDGRDLGVRKAIEVMKHDRSPLRTGQGSDGGRDRVSCVLADHRIGGSAAAIGDVRAWVQDIGVRPRATLLQGTGG